MERFEGIGMDAVMGALRAAGARFAFVHGSRALGTAAPTADLDVAAWFGRSVASWDVDLPPRVDLLVLDDAPDELAGRVAVAGEILFDDNPSARVAWQASTRKRYLDEAHRRRALVADVLGSRA